MKNKRSCSVKYILGKDVRSSGNSMIHRWISMLPTGICGTRAGAPVLIVDSGGGCVNRQMAVWI